ncbi:MAG: peptide chain release factor N(5)-glutamine methyltransferase [Candidatus Saccharibacteria bacterium]|nr:peptide chain release factor N(5)-glutamine methyltransferase [Candidatus Saccharibacteria bacterium]
MTVQELQKYGQQTLQNISTARLDTLVLLEDATDKDRAWLLAHPEHSLTPSQTKKFQAWVKRRVVHEPLAYIRGKTEFYGREFMVNARTLEPRPESETMIELFKSLDLPPEAVAADVGSGSGAIGITAALERPGIQINFLDIDPDTLAIARSNARKHGVRGQYYQGDLLEAWPIEYDVLLCNLPYVPDNFKINEAAMFEPKIAIFGGEDGLDLYRRLFAQLATEKFGHPIILTESLPYQHDILAAVAHTHGYQFKQQDDFIQIFYND